MADEINKASKASQDDLTMCEQFNLWHQAVSRPPEIGSDSSLYWLQLNGIGALKRSTVTDSNSSTTTHYPANSQ